MGAGREEAGEVREVGAGVVAVDERGERHVEHDVGVEREDLVEVVGPRRTPSGSMPAMLPGVATDLVGVGDEHADQIEIGSGRHRAEAPTAPRSPFPTAPPVPAAHSCADATT